MSQPTMTDVQGVFLPSYKTNTTAEALQRGCMGMRTKVQSLAISFVDLHHAGSSGPVDYDPGRAAFKDWGGQFQSLGLHGDVKRINRHTAEISTPCDDAQASYVFTPSGKTSSRLHSRALLRQSNLKMQSNPELQPEVFQHRLPQTSLIILCASSQWKMSN